MRSKEADYRAEAMEEVENLGEELMRKVEETEGIKWTERMEQLVGVCSSCDHFFYQKTRLNEEYFLCERVVGEFAKSGKRINTADPLVECSGYKKKGEMSLWDMKDMAILIERGGPKKAPGFKRDEWRSNYEK